MPGRLLEADQELQAAFTVADQEANCFRFSCKRCPAAWDVDVDPGGLIRSGERNALLQHARVHTGQGARLRRVAGR
jgi:hypothetical protein